MRPNRKTHDKFWQDLWKKRVEDWDRSFAYSWRRPSGPTPIHKRALEALYKSPSLRAALRWRLLGHTGLTTTTLAYLCGAKHRGRFASKLKREGLLRSELCGGTGHMIWSLGSVSTDLYDRIIRYSRPIPETRHIGEGEWDSFGYWNWEQRQLQPGQLSDERARTFHHYNGVISKANWKCLKEAINVGLK